MQGVHPLDFPEITVNKNLNESIELVDGSYLCGYCRKEFLNKVDVNKHIQEFREGFPAKRKILSVNHTAIILYVSKISIRADNVHLSCTKAIHR